MAPAIFGWRKDKRDDRDHLHAPVVLVPDSFTLAPFLPDVRDQGNLGSCTGFGIGGNLSGTAKQAQAFTEWWSPTWIYNGGRLIEKSLGEDSGCEPRDNLEFLRANGCLLEHFRPYKDTLDTTDPTTWGCAPEAAKWPILSYVRVTDGAFNICSAICEGHFVSIGSPWYWNDTDADGNLAEDYSECLGGHETFLYGYDKTLKVFYGQNSWGASWGKGGRYVMPFSAIDAFKKDGGYDAHYVTVEWAAPAPPDPPTPTPTPTPSAKKYLRVSYSPDGKATWKTLVTVKLP
jgi:hypothetical protein